MTTDWRIYEMLTKADWRPGDEPTIRNKVTIKHGDREIVIPLPPGATVEVPRLRTPCSYHKGFKEDCGCP